MQADEIAAAFGDEFRQEKIAVHLTFSLPRCLNVSLSRPQSLSH